VNGELFLPVGDSGWINPDSFSVNPLRGKRRETCFSIDMYPLTGIAMTYNGIAMTHSGIAMTYNGIAMTHNGIAMTHNGDAAPSLGVAHSSQ
jgi:hypothetical protein